MKFNLDNGDDEFNEMEDEEERLDSTISMSFERIIIDDELSYSDA